MNPAAGRLPIFDAGLQRNSGHAGSNPPLTGFSGAFLDVPGQHPAEVRQTI